MLTAKGMESKQLSLRQPTQVLTPLSGPGSQEELQTLQEQVAQAEKQLTEWEQRCAMLRGQCAQLELTQLQSVPQIAEKERVIARLGQEIQAARGKYQEQVDECRRMVQEIKQAEFSREKANETQQELVKLGKYMEAAGARLASAEQEISLLQEQAAAATAEMNSLVQRNQDKLRMRETLGDVIQQQRIETEAALQRQDEAQGELAQIQLCQNELESELGGIYASDKYQLQKQLEQEYNCLVDQLRSLQRQSPSEISAEISRVHGEIAAQKTQNIQLQMRMRAFGESEGYEDEDQPFEEYLLGLLEFMKARRRPRSSPEKAVQWNGSFGSTDEAEDYGADEFAVEQGTSLYVDQNGKEISLDQLLYITHHKGQLQVRLLVDPYQLDAETLLELYSQVDALNQQLKQKEFVQEVLKETEDSEIIPHSEHDTIDFPEENYSDDNYDPYEDFQYAW